MGIQSSFLALPRSWKDEVQQNGLKDPTSTELLTFYLLLKFVHLHFWFIHKLVCSQNYQLCKIVLPPPICSLLLPGYVALLSCPSAVMSIILFVFCRQFQYFLSYCIQLQHVAICMALVFAIVHLHKTSFYTLFCYYVHFVLLLSIYIWFCYWFHVFVCFAFLVSFW